MGPKNSKSPEHLSGTNRSEIKKGSGGSGGKSESSTKVINLQKQLNEDKLTLDDDEQKAKKVNSTTKKDSENKFKIGNSDFKINLQPITSYDQEKEMYSKEENRGERKDRLFIKSRTVLDNSKVIKDISQFSFIKVIGKGTFGKVILTKNKEDGNLYALKCVKKDYIIKTKNLENLKNEKHLLERLNNPFIIKLHFTFQNKEKIFFGFEYCNGGELFFHLSKNRRFKEEYVKIYAAEIYLALIYLHQHNIVYRDLKPENIILDKFGHIKIIDFGLAKGDVNSNNLTSTICGTNEYIPPEVISGAKYSFNFDWWGYGVIIYELLYGVPPFVDQTKSTLFKKIRETEPNYEVTRVSKEAKDLMQQLLKKDLNQRIRPENIPSHPFFKGFDFDDIKNLKIKPPFVPNVKNEDDLSNIDPVFLNENIYSPVKKRLAEFDQKSFIDF